MTSAKRSELREPFSETSRGQRAAAFQFPGKCQAFPKHLGWETGPGRGGNSLLGRLGRGRRGSEGRAALWPSRLREVRSEGHSDLRVFVG